MTTEGEGGADALRQYMISVSVREPECIRRLRLATQDHRWACMATRPEVGQFLAMLVRLTGARRVLEVGTFMGCSALWMAMALPPEGRLLTIDIHRQWNEIARQHWREAGVEGRIEARLAPALVELDRLRSEGREAPFDLAFLDADKRNYPAYLELLLGLLRPGGLLVVDNVLWGGHVLEPGEGNLDAQAIRTFNARLAEDPRVDVSMIPLGDGLTLAIRRD